MRQTTNQYIYVSHTEDYSFRFEVVYTLKEGYIIKAEEGYFKISKQELQKAHNIQGK